MSTIRTLVVALVVAALGAPATQAQPADMHASTAIAAAEAAKKQDLRSPDARDAARQPRTAQASPDAAGSGIQRIPAAPAAPDPGIDWLPIAIAAAAGLAAISVLGRRRLRRPDRTRAAA